jgi:hypothetical protein
MPYLGPSKGCNSCKWRRKKCDEARPSCLRCIKAGRPCGGYEHSALSPFRHHTTPGTQIPTILPTTARKCMLPRRSPLPGTDLFPEDAIPLEVSQAQSNGLALRAFFYDYCIVPTNRHISRGYFAELEMMAYRLGVESDLVKACLAVSFGAHSKPLNRPQLLRKADLLYQDLLRTFARAIESRSPSDEPLLGHIATLLGLYQVLILTIIAETCGDPDFNRWPWPARKRRGITKHMRKACPRLWESTAQKSKQLIAFLSIAANSSRYASGPGLSHRSI